MPIRWDANKRMAILAGAIVLSDQITKFVVTRTLEYARDEKIVIDGFFKFVHWWNTGAAWSLFHGHNKFLAIVSLVALAVLVIFRNHFDTRTWMGQLSLGLILGGIVGNLIDRVFRGHVVDFLYFHLHQRDGRELGFPAFNIADSAICTGVGLLFLLSLKYDSASSAKTANPAGPANAAGENA